MTIGLQAYLQGYLHEKTAVGPAAGFNREYDEWIRSPNARGFRPDSPQEDDAFFMREMEDWSEMTPNYPNYRQDEQQKMQWIQEGSQKQRKLDRSRKQPSPVDRTSVRGRRTRIDTTHPGSVRGYKKQDFTRSPLS